MPLDQKGRTRLASLLAMLASPYAGERDNAARAIERWRQATGLDWHEILGDESTSDELAVVTEAAEQLMKENLDLKSTLTKILDREAPKTLIHWQVSGNGNAYARANGRFVVIVANRRGSSGFRVGYNYHEDQKLMWTGVFVDESVLREWCENFLRGENTQ